MKANKRRFICRSTALSLVLSVLSMSTAQAAEGVRWVDLPKKIGRSKMRSDGREDREYRVVTKDGLVHVGHRLTFSPTGVRPTDPGPAIPREQVVEIRIRRDGRLKDALLAPGAVLFSGLDSDHPLLFIGTFLLAPVLLPVALGVTAAAAPVVLPVEGIRRLLPDKVVRVVP